VFAFLAIGGIGLVLLIASLLLGDLFDGALGSVLDGVNLGALDAGWLSGAAVSGFLAAFGFVGALVAGPAGTLPAVLAGLGAGVVVAGFAGWLTRALTRAGTDVTPNATTVIGCRGTVVSPVPSEGFGEVSVVVAGHLSKYHARCSEPLPMGRPVVVVGVLSPTAVRVEPVLDHQAPAW
jgi:membrane protein implicated in regulation of membrane protease activity